MSLAIDIPLMRNPSVRCAFPQTRTNSVMNPVCPAFIQLSLNPNLYWILRVCIEEGVQNLANKLIVNDLITLNEEEFWVTIEILSQHITPQNSIWSLNSFANSDNSIYLSSNCQKWKSKTMQSVNLQLKPVYACIFNDKIKISNDWTNQKRTPNFISDFTLSGLFNAFFHPVGAHLHTAYTSLDTI